MSDKSAIVMWLKQHFCRHSFAIEDLTLTGIPAPQKPAAGSGYAEWENYYKILYTGEHHTKRVRWPCAKCGKVFFAHCGLDISPAHGLTLRRDPRPASPPDVPWHHPKA